MKISGGISYVRIGDAQTTLDGTNAASNFTGNHALGAGIKVSYSF
jgi:long-chain fatty acid transport protein